MANEHSDILSCPALVISAPSSGNGKTSITAGIARYHANRGRRVTIFKIGPDFLDPMIHERASGNPVYNIDLWMMGEAEARRQLVKAAAKSDLILLEGVMGAFDGITSSADCARCFDMPILFVIDASTMAATFGAIAHGLRSFQSDLKVLGVIGNRVASPNHEKMITESLKAEERYLGTIFRDLKYALPSRHLGLVQASEVRDLEEKLDILAEAVGRTLLAELPPPVSFRNPGSREGQPFLLGKRIGIAKDEAFSFIYIANTDVLLDLGAELVYFSPLRDSHVPEVDALWFPGGYPELHVEQLSNNSSMHESIRAFHANDKPIYGECGGMLYLMDSITDYVGKESKMVGLLEGKAIMQKKLVSVGMQEIIFTEGSLKGHSFHHSKLETTAEPTTHTIDQRNKSTGEAVYKVGKLFLSYFHGYFPSNMRATASLFADIG
ncbi:MAG: cobyrinic acid a,c-diamide synthase [Coxiella sp. RIFCSPHIGHO2_12_FULL_44_14]|nr:MAG: cobyrinic acid a,c-diamide synthase [Coxiella sp. RIFCSPHIGHO2_12_FULL_44_14]